MAKRMIRNYFSLLLIVCLIGISVQPSDAAGNAWQTVGGAGFVSTSIVDMSVCDGIPYVAYQDNMQNKKITVMKYNGTAWVNVGNPGFTQGQVHEFSLFVSNGTPYIATRDMSLGNKVSVMKYDGTSWKNVGNASFSDGYADYISLYVDNNTPYVAYKDSMQSQKITVKKYDGTSWNNVGQSGFSQKAAECISLFVDNGTPYVAYKDSAKDDKASVMRYDGNSWVYVGTQGFSVSSVCYQRNTTNPDPEYVSLQVSNGTPYVAYKDLSKNGKLTVMKYNGTSWVSVGNPGFTNGIADHSTLFVDGETPYIAFRDSTQNKATVMKYNGSSWEYVGIAGFSAGLVESISLMLDNGVPYIAYRDVNYRGATVMKYAVPEVSAPVESTPQPVAPPDEPVTPEEPSNQESANGFSDTSDHWAREIILEMSSEEIINGVGNNLFEPERDITRAEFAAVIIRALDCTKTNNSNPFSDISVSDWYYDSVLAAFENELITGYNDGSFMPQSSITRQEAMAIVVRAISRDSSLELNINEITNILAAFSDRDSVSDWAKASAALCIKEDIITGRSGNTIAAQDNITRAETAVIIKRLLQKIAII